MSQGEISEISHGNLLQSNKSMASGMACITRTLLYWCCKEKIYLLHLTLLSIILLIYEAPRSEQDARTIDINGILCNKTSTQESFVQQRESKSCWHT